MQTWLGRAIHRVRETELIVLVAVCIIVAGVWAFVELADEVMEQQTQRFDDRILRWMRNPQDPSKTVGPSWVADVGRDITALGGIAVLSLVTLAVAGFLVMRRQYHATVFVLVATVGGLLISTGLKWVIGRPRPSVVPTLAGFSHASFPSGHSMLSATVYLTLGALLARFITDWRVRIYILTVAMLLTLLVGVSRVLMGVHYPTDVLAGWTAGLVWAILCWLAARHLQKRGAVEQQDDPAA